MPLDKGFFQLYAPSKIGPGQCAAMITDQKKIFIATRPELAQPQPFSAVIDLIQWLNATNKSHDLQGIPIYYVGKELMKHESVMAEQNNWTIAKLNNRKDPDKLEMRLYKEKFTERVEEYEVPADTIHQQLAGYRLGNLGPVPGVRPLDVPKLYMLAAFSLVAKKALEAGRVAAILVSSDGEILSYGIKDPENATLHAEVMTLQSLFVNNPNRWGVLATAETFLFTTLKPCSMCAAMITTCGKGRVQVVFAQDDSGGHAANTSLDNSGKQQKLLDDIRLKSDNVQTGLLIASINDFRSRNPGGPIVKALDKPEPLNLFDQAHARTLHKAGKYAGSADEEKTGKQKTMDHIKPFLTSLNIIT